MMKVRYKGETDVSLTANKIYEVLSTEDGLYRIVDDTEEDYLYPPEQFEILEKQKNFLCMLINRGGNDEKEWNRLLRNKTILYKKE